MEQTETPVRELIPIKIRPATADDLRFVLHSWIRSFGQSSIKHALNLSEWLICKSYEKILTKRLPEMEVLIAASPEDDTQILGYMAYEEKSQTCALHFVYVKDYIRGERICQRLLERLPRTVLRTYSYPAGKAWANRVIKEFHFNPFHLLGIFIDDPKENLRHDKIEKCVSVPAS